MPIDGLVSGLNTTQIVSQLMDVERAPQKLLQNQQNSVQTRLSALGSVQSKLDAVATAAQALQRSTGWNLRTATSSDTSVATVSATAGAAAGTLSFTVARRAAAHGVVTGATMASAATVISAGRSIGLTVGGVARTVAVGGTGSVGDVAAAINAAGVGVQAAVVSTGSGVRLQLSAASTGAAGVFTVDSGLDAVAGGTVITNQGADARITVGQGAGAYDITSATNTLRGVMPGVDVTLVSESANPVTVTVASDANGYADRVQAMVNATNSALSTIAELTRYDSKTKSSSPLTGDAAVARAAQSLRRAVSDAVAQSTLGGPSGAGLSLDRSGQVSFDRTRFLAAFAADPAATQRLFTQGATTTGAITFAGAGDRARAGTFDVAVTSYATPATATGLTGVFPPAAPLPTVRVKIGATEAAYTVLATDTAATAAAGLQAAATAAGLGVAVTAPPAGGIRIDTTALGSAAALTVAWDGTNYATSIGADAVATIGGVEANAVANLATVAVTDRGIPGMSVNLTGTATGTVGTVNYEPGIAQRLASAVSSANDTVVGYLSTASTAGRSTVDRLTRQIKDWDVRLAARQTALQRQFSNLETILGNLRNQSNWLAGQLGSLPTTSSSRSNG